MLALILLLFLIFGGILVFALFSAIFMGMLGCLPILILVLALVGLDYILIKLVFKRKKK